MNYSAPDIDVVLLAAGQGKRMRPLTENTPKPLLKVGQYSLVEHHLFRLAKQGFKNIVINLDYLGHKIQQQLGNGNNYDLNIHYSDESVTGALETAGGLKKALPLINSDPFLVVNADIWTDYPFNRFLMPLKNSAARLLMVNNPEHNASGDFSFQKDNSLLTKAASTSLKTYTYSGIGLYKKSVFTNLPEGKLALGPVLYQLISTQQLEGELYQGQWSDIGTPERLAKINQQYS